MGKLNFKEGIKMLHEAGIEQDVNEDLSTETEKALGKLVFQKYETDFYILYGYPKSARPFYTMPILAMKISLTHSMLSLEEKKLHLVHREFMFMNCLCKKSRIRESILKL